MAIYRDRLVTKSLAVFALISCQPKGMAAVCTAESCNDETIWRELDRRTLCNVEIWGGLCYFWSPSLIRPLPECPVGRRFADECRFLKVADGKFLTQHKLFFVGDCACFASLHLTIMQLSGEGIQPPTQTPDRFVGFRWIRRECFQISASSLQSTIKSEGSVGGC